MFSIFVLVVVLLVSLLNFWSCFFLAHWSTWLVSWELLPQSIELLIVFTDQVWITSDDQILLVVECGLNCPVKWPSNQNFLIDHYELVMHMVSGFGVSHDGNSLWSKVIDVASSVLHTLIISNDPDLNSSKVQVTNSAWELIVSEIKHTNIKSATSLAKIPT